MTTLSTYITAGKIVPPKSVTTGGITVYLWTDADVARARKLLPKIANGRKTRWQKQREREDKTQARASQPQHAKTTGVGDPGAVLQKKKPSKKKKQT